MTVPLARVIESYRGLAERMAELARLYPGAEVARNDVGNFAVLNARGTYVAWIDVITGEIELV